MLPLLGVWVPSLVKELRSHLHCGAPFKKKKKNCILLVVLEWLVKNLKLIGCCKSNCGFAVLTFAIWCWNTFLNMNISYIILMCISHFVFLLMIYYLLYILHAFETMKMMLDKKANSSSFLTWVKKWVIRQWRHNINNAFGPGSANGLTVQWWFMKFCKGDKSIEYENSGWPSEVDNYQLRAFIEAGPLTTRQV